MYRLTDGDRAIFARAEAENNPNWFLNFYFYRDDRGTYWYPIRKGELRKLTFGPFWERGKFWREGYLFLKRKWRELGKPEFFGEFGGRWRKLAQEEYEQLRSGRHYRVYHDERYDGVVFHHRHGILLLPWQLEMARTKQFVSVVIGGYGGGKTMGALLLLLYYAATLRKFRGFVLAPVMRQAEESWRLGMDLISGTEYERRFLSRASSRPPRLIIQNDLVGESTIEFFPLDDPQKIRTLTGDMAVVDQSEKINPLEVLHNVGTRFRGTVDGRPRLGRLIFLANSEDNPELWALYDRTFTEPEQFWGTMPGTADNPYLTFADLLRYQIAIGDDPVLREQYLLGRPPLADGAIFGRRVLERVRDIQRFEETKAKAAAKEPGYVFYEVPRLGCVLYEEPYDERHKYMVAADPGWASPPERNAAAVLAFQVTDFPEQPARLVGFEWVYGNNDPNPWISAFGRLVRKYNAFGYCGFDATGQQSGYERLPVGLDVYRPLALHMTAQNKYSYVNLASKMLSDGRIIIPAIQPIFVQLSRYNLPDTKLAQDIVAALLVAVALLEHRWYGWLASKMHQETGESYSWFPDRHSRMRWTQYER